MQTIKLYFAGEPKDVPFKQVISRSVIRAVETPIGALRQIGQNAALQQALQSSPNAGTFMTLTGGVQSSYATEQRKLILEAYPNLDADKVEAEILTRVQAKLLDEYPAIWAALNNPVTTFPLDNDEAVEASINIVKAIIDEKQLTEQEKALMAIDTFWDEQDLVEVASAVATFREATKL